MIFAEVNSKKSPVVNDIVDHVDETAVLSERGIALGIVNDQIVMKS